MFSEQTGKFPTKSRQGNKYIMVMTKIDRNAIIVEPTKSRIDEEMIRVYQALLSLLICAGIFPKKHLLENEISDKMKNIIRD